MNAIRTNDRTTPVLIGLGANVGDPPRQLRRALDQLERFMKVEATSDVYRSEPVGVREQPDFLNLVALGSTELSVYALHAALGEVEAAVGRRPGGRNGPREIDLDLLTFGELALVSDRLQVPHPRMLERPFVLAPLLELDPGWTHPVDGTAVEDAFRECAGTSWVERAGPLPGRGI